MPSTQQHLPIEEIKDGLVFLKSGSVAQVIETTAVNFGLLFETEQVSIIDSFAGLLNSLSFPIQIIIRSQKLDVSSYLGLIDQAAQNQTSLLIKGLTLKYRSFVAQLIKENEVLDKRFYIIISAASLEIGLGNKTVSDRTQKAVVLLKPRTDHLIRQLARIGLKATPLHTLDLVRLYYDFYNPKDYVTSLSSMSEHNPKDYTASLNSTSEHNTQTVTVAVQPAVTPTPQPVFQAPPIAPQSLNLPIVAFGGANSHSPFFVEELSN